MTSENKQKNRLIYQYLSQIDKNHLLLLTGARQTGKTTSVKHLFPDLPYYNLDASEYRDYLSGISSFQWGTTIGEAVLDEIQKEPELFEKIKYAFDENTIRTSILLGSAQILLMQKVKETLAGRILLYELWPLCLSELITPVGQSIQKPLLSDILETGLLSKTCNNSPEQLEPQKEDNAVSAQKYLLNWGGMPALLNIDNGLKKDWLRSYNAAYLERDLLDLSRLHDLKPFKKFHQLAALRAGQLLAYTDIARDAGLSIETIRRYLEYLKISYQTFLLQPYYSNLTNIVIKTPKLYWIDTGLWRQMTGIWDTTTGELFENYVVAEIYKYIHTLKIDAKLYFYRTRSGMEVDLLCETAKGIIGFEIKSRDHINSKDYTNLKKLSDVLKEKWLGGVVIYRGSQIVECDKNIWGIPSHRLLT